MIFQALPPIHLDWTISVGNLALLGMVLIALRKLKPLYDAMQVFMAEHAMLMDDYAKRTGTTVGELQRVAVASHKARATGAGR